MSKTTVNSTENPKKRTWPITPFQTSWDDLLDGIETPEHWYAKRSQIQHRLQALLRQEAAPPVPSNLGVQIEQQWQEDGYRVQQITYQVEADERAVALLAIPDEQPPAEGFPAVVCLHGTVDWGMGQTLGIPPAPDSPHYDPKRIKKETGKDFARQLVRRGYVTISPEHFCCGRRGRSDVKPFTTESFYEKHPNWTAVGKAVHENQIATTILADLPFVNANALGATGHSLGAHSTIFLAAYDERIRCAAPNCSARTFRENSAPLHWSRDYWYIYFPQLREQFLAGRQIQCDFHEIMSLIAPRPLLDRMAFNDGDPDGQEHRTTLHVKLHQLYRLLGHEAGHAYFAHGDGHSVSSLSCTLLHQWMDRWLKFDGDPDCHSELITQPDHKHMANPARDSMD